MPSVSTSSLIGVAIACSGNILISLALTVQKLAHRRQEEDHARRLSGDHGEEEDARKPSDAGGSSGVEDEEQRLIAVPVMVLPDKGRNALGISMDNRGSAASTILPGTGERESFREDGLIPQSPGTPSPTRSLKPLPGQMNGRSPSPHRSRHSRTEPSEDDIQEESMDAGANQEDGPEGEGGVEEGAYLKSKLWWVGLALMSLGEGGNFLSYAFAPASVVAPLGTVALVANCVLAPLILKERFYPRELIGMALAILGAVTVVYASNDSNPRLDPDELLQAISQIPFIVYTAINVLLLIILLPMSRSEQYGGRWVGIDVLICALFGGYTVLATKAQASLLSIMFLAAYGYPIMWILLFVLVGTSVAQVKYLNKALMRFQSKEVIPTQFVFFSLAAITGSAVLYQEFRNIPFSNFVNFAFGILTTFLGVHLLTTVSSPSPPSTPDSHSAPSSPRTITPSDRRAVPRLSSASERTPLLIAPSPRASIFIPPSTSTAPIASSRTGVSATPTSGGPLVSPSMAGFRLLKRVSTSDFAPTLGLNSQAGFLLMATTPPPTATAMQRRENSISRAERGSRDVGRDSIDVRSDRRVSDLDSAKAVRRRASDLGGR